MEAERIAKSLTIYQTTYRAANAKRKEEEAKAAKASTDAAAANDADGGGGGGGGDKKGAKKATVSAQNGAKEKTAPRKISGEIIKKVSLITRVVRRAAIQLKKR